MDEDHHVLISALFLRLLALIYLAAFVSTGFQIMGLAGEQGILPVAERIAQLKLEYGWAGFWRFPTLFWLNASGDALAGTIIAGCLFSLMLLFNQLPRLSLIALFVLYLSVFHAGQLFMNFQWDYLLLEAGFIAIFLPFARHPAVWLMRWLLFRVRFLSGLSKIVSQDPTWANLTALNYFFEVQPLPHWGGWYAHQLPDWILQFGTGAALFIELVIPFFIFMPRKLRLFGAWATILMQVLILLTSNHNYANFLVLALCLFLFEDRDIRRVMPGAVISRLMDATLVRVQRPSAFALTLGVGVVLFLASLFQGWAMVMNTRPPEPFATVIGHIRPFRVVNNYHVFPTMKTERIELIIEGTRDGYHWKPYMFRYKPGDVMRRPEVIVPHHPRLDWLMWFVPMHPVFLPWFDRFLDRLLENSPAVLSLLESNPFPDAPPEFVRVSVYRYRFTDIQTRNETGQWWQREYLGPFGPLPWKQRGPVSLR